MQKIKDLLNLIRWQNLLFIGILLWVMEKWVAVPVLDRLRFGEQLPWYVLLLLIAGTILVAAGGYVINDYFDVKIDRINRPDNLIVTNSISKVTAMRISLVLSAVGILSGMGAAWLVRSWSVAIVFLMVPGLLWFYSSSYKRLFLIGNIIIAFISALTPMLIAFANVGILRYRYGDILGYTSLEHDLYSWLGGFAMFAFLCTWVREVIKDLQDRMGDRELECHTLPIRLGERGTKAVVTVVIALTIAAVLYVWYAVLPFPHTWASLSTRYVLCGILIPMLCEIWLLWASRIPSDYRHAQLLMKFVMFIGMLYAFVIMRML
ncbi:MAG: geranylgeranylglycerol-phosphate geranylgeranyltransferase [Paludibacteraceae bacterium]